MSPLSRRPRKPFEMGSAQRPARPSFWPRPDPHVSLNQDLYQRSGTGEIGLGPHPLLSGHWSSSQLWARSASSCPSRRHLSDSSNSQSDVLQRKVREPLGFPTHWATLTSERHAKTWTQPPRCESSPGDFTHYSRELIPRRSCGLAGRRER